MPITSGPQIAALAAGMGALDAIAENTGNKAPGPALSAVISALVGDVQSNVSEVVGGVVAWSLQRYGLENVQLDADHPFSDASLSGALSTAIGVQCDSVKDKEQLKDAFRRAITARLSAEVGVTFSDVFDREALKHDVLLAVGAKVAGLVPGLVLHDLSDRVVTIDDVSAFALGKLSEAVGVDFGDNLRNASAIREAVIAWAMPQVQPQVEAEQEAGTAYTGRLLMDKKSVANREAQRRFRQKWGSLRHYEDL